MGLIRNVHSRFKDLDQIIEELKETGLEEEQLASYYNLKKIYESGEKGFDKLDRYVDKQEGIMYKEGRKIDYLENRLEQIKDNDHMGFSAKRKQEKSLKRRIKRAKIRMKRAERAAEAKRKSAEKVEKSLNRIRKCIKKLEKSLRNMWSKSKHEIKLVKQFKDKQNIISKIYDIRTQKAINKCIKELQKYGELPIGVEAKDLNREIEKAIKNNKKPEESVVENAEPIEHVDGEIIDNKNDEEVEQVHGEVIDNEDVKEETQEYEFTSTEMPEFSWVMDPENEERGKEEEILKNDNQANTNEFKEEVKKDVFFGKDSTIDRRTVEMMQKNENNDILRAMPAEEYIAYIGFVESKRRNSEKVKYEDFLEEIQDDKYFVKQRYARTALKSLEKMKSKNLTEDEIDELDEADKFIYGKAEDYNEIEEELKRQYEQSAQEQGR